MMSAPRFCWIIHGARRRQSFRAAVQMAAEGDAFVVNPVDFAKAKYLKSAGIRQERTTPAHKFVETAHITHEFVAGPQVEVIGVGQDQVDVEFFQIARGGRL